MKHAAVLYTCVGLMGAAAIAGFKDYTDASKTGVMSKLYREETAATGSTFIPKKISYEDYSRGPIDEYVVADEKQTAGTDDPKKKKKKLPPPPPPKVVKKKFDAPPPPPPPPPPPAKKKSEPSAEDVIAPLPPAPPETEEKTDIPPVPPVEESANEKAVAPVTEVKEINWKSFSRGPLKKKKVSAVINTN